MNAIDRIAEIFWEAAQFVPGEERDAYLAGACGDDPALRQRVEKLLQAQPKAEQFLERPFAGPVTGVELPAPCEGPGSVIGPYKLLEQIGEGGMGLVFMAEQTHPVRRRVALKILKPGMDTRQVVARFEAERQALAMMDHPNIARILDAGTTASVEAEAQRGVTVNPPRCASASGRPYFVMELVKGVAITEFCDQRRFTTRQRLELFVTVCHAVQHAHQKGIIHRDLKPSNVLVTLHDTVAVPKIIDFGIAKALHQPLTDATLFTQFAQMIGTPLYMSPEQAEMNGLDVDTRSDVYSLGVLLYELLTGTTPFESETLRRVGPDEMRRMIREDEPPRPSHRVSTLAAAADTTVSHQRRVDVRRLGDLLRGELDWIVMKSLDKDRSRRYESASALAADVQRYLSDEPVQACPPTAGYRLRKFTRRNRGPVTAASLVLLALVGGITGTTWGLIRAEDARQDALTAQRSESDRAEGERHAKLQALAAAAAEKVAKESAEKNELLAKTERDRAEQEREVAQAVRDFLRKRLLLQADALTQANSLLAEGSSASFVERDPRISVLLARASAELAPDKIEESFPKQPLLQAELLRSVGNTYERLGDSVRAISHLERAKNLYEAQFNEQNSDTLGVTHDLAVAYGDAGRMPEAVRLLEQVRDGRVARLREGHPDTLETMDYLGMGYAITGKLKDAIALLEHVRDTRLNKLGEDDTETLKAQHNLAMAYGRAGNVRQAIDMLEAVSKKCENKLGPQHPHTLATLNNLGMAYGRTGRASEAIQVLKGVETTCVEKLGDDHPATLMTLSNLARAHGANGNVSEAIRILQIVRVRCIAKLGGDHPGSLSTSAILVTAYQAGGKSEPARILSEELSLRKALAEQKPRSNHDSLAYAGNLESLGLNLLGQKRYAEAESMLRESLTIREKKEPDSWTTFQTASKLGAALLAQKKYLEAEPLLLAGFRGMRAREAKIPASVKNVRLSEALRVIVQLYEEQSKHDEAAKWRKELESVTEPKEPPM